MNSAIRAGRLLVPAVLALAPAASAQTTEPAATSISHVGAEFRANAQTINRQIYPSAASLADGSFMVTFQDESDLKPYFSTEVYMHHVSAKGVVAKGADIHVNTQFNLTQGAPRALALKSGFVVTWNDNSGTGADKFSTSIRGQVFNSKFAKTGATNFVINNPTKGAQYSQNVALLKNGNFVTVWEDHSAVQPTIRGRIFTAAGKPLNGGFQVNAPAQFEQLHPSVATLSTGNFVVVWASFQGVSSLDIHAQLFNQSGGKVGTEMVVNSAFVQGSQDWPTVASIGSGRFVVAWEDGQTCCVGVEIKAQIMASNGAKVGGIIPVNDIHPNDQLQPHVVGFPNGRFLVVWTHNKLPNDSIKPRDDDIHGRLFTNAGVKLAKEITVNTTTAGRQEDAQALVLRNGDFVVVWSDWSGKKPDNPPNNDVGIRGQVFHITH
jgi:hypothetical protein